MNFVKDYNLYYPFMKVVEQKNYSTVARMLGFSSPESIRERMEVLAMQVGVKKLFYGHSRGVTPTNEAIELYHNVKKHFENIDLAEKNIKAFTEKSETVLNIGISSTILNFLLADYFIEFSKKYPFVKFKIFTRVHTERFKLLAHREIDFVIDMDYNCKANGLEIIELFELNYIFIASQKFLDENNLSTNMTIEQLEKLYIIGDPEIYAFSKIAGFSANPYITVAVTDSIFPLVEKGMGIGVYYDKLFDAQVKDGCDVVKVNIIKSKPHKLKFVCGSNTGYLTKAAQTFIEGLVQYAKKL